MMPYNGDTLQPIFHRILIMIENLFMKRAQNHIDMCKWIQNNSVTVHVPGKTLSADKK